MTTYVEMLAGYIAGFGADTLPEKIITRLKCCLFYNLSMGMAGYSADDLTWNAIRSLNSAGGKSSLLVTGEMRTPQDAAFANAALITSRGQNDTLQDAQGHLGCIVIPAVLALAQERRTPVAEVLAALAAGYETQAKVARGAAPLAGKRGFRATSVFGVFGSAAGAARVIGLDEAKTAHALAIASNFAAGTMQCWADGSMEWRLQVAHASKAGLVAALFAEQGITGAPNALEGSVGFYRAFAGEVPPLKLDDWSIERVMFKPYPGCAINQGPTYALLSLLERERIETADIDGVVVYLSPDQLNYPGVDRYGPFATPSGAVMSAAFMLTVAMRDRALYQRHFTQEYGDAAVNERSRLVTPEADPSLPTGSCRVLVRLRGGAELEAACTEEGEFLFSWEDTVRLVRPLASEMAISNASERIERLRAMVDSIEEHSDVSDLMSLCTAA